MDIMNNPIQSFDRSHAPLAVVLPQPRPSLEVLHTLTVIDKLIVLLNFSDVKNTRKYFALVWRGRDTLRQDLASARVLLLGPAGRPWWHLLSSPPVAATFPTGWTTGLVRCDTGQNQTGRSVPSGREGANLTVGKHRRCGEVPKRPQWPTQPTAPRPQSPSAPHKKW